MIIFHETEQALVTGKIFWGIFPLLLFEEMFSFYSLFISFISVSFTSSSIILFVLFICILVILSSLPSKVIKFNVFQDFHAGYFFPSNFFLNCASSVYSDCYLFISSSIIHSNGSGYWLNLTFCFVIHGLSCHAPLFPCFCVSMCAVGVLIESSVHS
jgi:hypothetical protein